MRDQTKCITDGKPGDNKANLSIVPFHWPLCLPLIQLSARTFL